MKAKSSRRVGRCTEAAASSVLTAPMPISAMAPNSATPVRSRRSLGRPPRNMPAYTVAKMATRPQSTLPWPRTVREPFMGGECRAPGAPGASKRFVAQAPAGVAVGQQLGAVAHADLQLALLVGLHALDEV